MTAEFKSNIIPLLDMNLKIVKKAKSLDEFNHLCSLYSQILQNHSKKFYFLKIGKHIYQI